MILTDKYPNIDSFKDAERTSDGALGFISTPVDATAVPTELDGFRTLFNAFHHFDPVTARNIVHDAVMNRVGIGVFEYTERSFLWYVYSIFMPLFFWVTGPFAIRPFSFAALFWIYLFPIPVLLFTWDGIISCQRTYSTESLQALANSIRAPDYVWEVGKARAFWGVCRVTYLIGYPSTERAGR